MEGKSPEPEKEKGPEVLEVPAPEAARQSPKHVCGPACGAEGKECPILAARRQVVEEMLKDIVCDFCGVRAHFREFANLTPVAVGHGTCRECWYKGQSRHVVIIGNTSCVGCQRSPVEKEKTVIGCLCGTYHGLCEACWKSDPDARWADKFPDGHPLWHREYGVLDLCDLGGVPYPDSLRGRRPGPGQTVVQRQAQVTVRERRQGEAEPKPAVAAPVEATPPPCAAADSELLEPLAPSGAGGEGEREGADEAEEDLTLSEPGGLTTSRLG